MQDFPVSDQKFHLSDEDFKNLIVAYKLNFSSQLKFNEDFGIQRFKPKDSSPQSLKEFLQTKLNQAFQDPDKLNKYLSAIETASYSSDRGIHDGFHTASVALYARNFLKIYQDNRDLFSEEMQAQIAEFDDPKKVRDLEILCLLHDVARVDKYYDQDEYKNAFYVALMLRNMGDERFQGNEISEEGLKMIMDLATKESKEKDKSLMSKLIQSSDSLAILRVKKFNTKQSKYNPLANDVYNDFANAESRNPYLRNKLLNSWKHMQSQALFVENKYYTTEPFLEFAENPMKKFLKHNKIKKLDECFLIFDKINSPLSTIGLSTEKTDPLFVHVLTPFNKDALDKCDPDKFICTTMLIDGAIIKHYAERGWINNPFLIFSDKDVIPEAFFKTDVGSNILKRSLKARMPSYFGGFQSNIEMSNYVSLDSKRLALSDFFFDELIIHPDQFALKLKEMTQRRGDKELDISDGSYWLVNNDTGERKMGRVGVERYGELYSKPHFLISTLDNELRHNECHVRTALHIANFVGVSENLMDFQIELDSVNADQTFSALKRIQKYKDQINAEKKRISILDDPMQDKVFRKCVEFELSRVTNLFEKIHFLQKKREEIERNPNNKYWLKSLEKKQKKKSEFDGFVFEKSKENREIWNQRKIEKINKNLVELFANLREFQQEENFGFKDLPQELESIQAGGCDFKTFGIKIAQWKAEIMDGRTNQEQLKFAIERVKMGLQKETKMALLNVYNPQEIIILSDEKLSERMEEIAKNEKSQKCVFNYFFGEKNYLEIFKNFDKEKIKEFFHQKNTLFKKDNDFDNFVFREKFSNCSKSEFEELIQAGLDIYKFDEKEVQCLGFISQSTIQPDSYKIAKKTNNPQITETLLEYGVLVSDQFNLQENKAEKDMAKFCQLLKSGNSEILDQLKLELEKYKTKEDLKELTFFSFDGSEVKLNGYGLLRIYENNLIPNLSSEISELFAQLNEFAGSKDLNSRANTEAKLIFPLSLPKPVLIFPNPFVFRGQIASVDQRVSTGLVFDAITNEPSSRPSIQLDPSIPDQAGGVGFRESIEPTGKGVVGNASASVVKNRPSLENSMF